MACLEHSCACGFATFNNDPAPMRCPECGEWCVRIFDEREDDRKEADEHTQENVDEGES